MENLFHPNTYQSIVSRIEQLNANTTAQWGKMDVAQMLAHCKEGLKVPLAAHPLHRHPLGILIGWLFKSSLHNNQPWKRNLPTSPQFKITDQRNFMHERDALLQLIAQFHQSNPSKIELVTHPMFGKFTGNQWGQAMYKHLHHHLTQFGV